VAQLETRATTTIPGEVLNIVSGDFNSDGKLDIAVAGGGLWVLVGNGDGTFQRPVVYSYPLGVPIAVGDFNGDGKLDLVVTGALGDGGPSGNTVNVLLGNGDGTFQAPLVSPTTEFPTFVAVGDFNHDGKVDVVIIDPPYISVLLGNGDGTFQAPKDNSSFPDYPVWLVVGDFNNDHHPDVAVVGYFGSNIDMGVLLGNGDGTLRPSLTSPLNDTPYSIAAGDFNHDGNLDVAISDYFVPGDVVVQLGNGDGSFQSAVDYPTTGAGGEVVAHDLNADGELDLVLGGGVLFGNGDGTFGPIQLFPGAGSPFVVGDFNGDRKPDVAGLIGKPSGVITLLNTGVVNFSPSSPMSFPSQLINTTSGPKTVQLTNRGTVALSITSIETSQPFQASNTCGGSVAAGASCTINLTFSPQKSGSQNGLVTLLDSASSKPQVIEVFGLGTALKLSPTTLNFGTQKIKTTSPPRTVTVTNEGSSTVTFNLIEVGGKDYADFRLESETCSPSLAAGASCTATLTFDPSKTGPRSADFVVTVYSGGAPVPVALTGTGTSTPN
jgi:hypothetical protein